MNFPKNFFPKNFTQLGHRCRLDGILNLPYSILDVAGLIINIELRVGGDADGLGHSWTEIGEIFSPSRFDGDAGGQPLRKGQKFLKVNQGIGGFRPPGGFQYFQ